MHTRTVAIVSQAVIVFGINVFIHSPAQNLKKVVPSNSIEPPVGHDETAARVHDAVSMLSHSCGQSFQMGNIV